MNKLRIGFMSTAGIGRKNWKAIHSSGNCVVTAVASRDLDRSRRFIAENQQAAAFPTPPTPLAGYEALLAANDVDAVYNGYCARPRPASMSCVRNPAA